MSRKPIQTASLPDLADEMKRGGFSHLPILREHDAVIGVFNEAVLFDHPGPPYFTFYR